MPPTKRIISQASLPSTITQRRPSNVQQFEPLQ